MVLDKAAKSLDVKPRGTHEKPKANVRPAAPQVPFSLMIVSGFLGAFCVLYPGRPATLTAIVVYAGVTSALSFDYAALYAFGLSVLYVIDRTSFGLPVGLMAGVAILLGTFFAAGGPVRTARRGLHPTLVLALAVALYTYLRPASTHAGAVSSFSLIFLPLGIFFLLSYRRIGPGANRSVNWFSFGVALTIGRALLTAYQHISENYQGYENVRIFTSGIGSSNYAAALALVTALCIAFTPVKTRLRRFLCWACATPFFLAPFFFASRGAITALGLTLVAIFLRAAVKKKSVNLRVFAPIAVSAASLIFVLVASQQRFFFWERFVDPSNNSSGYLAGRVGLWKFTLDLIQNNIGIGTAPGRLTDELLSGLSFAYPHQFFLGVVAQLGVVAAALYLYMIRPRPMRWSPVAPSLIAICINSAVEPVLSTPAGAALGAGLLAVHAIACQEGASDE